MSIFQVGWNDQKANKIGAETHYHLISVFSQKSINTQPFWSRNLRGNVIEPFSQEGNIDTTTKWSCLDLVCNAISVYSHQNMLSNYISCFLLHYAAITNTNLFVAYNNQGLFLTHTHQLQQYISCSYALVVIIQVPGLRKLLPPGTGCSQREKGKMGKALQWLLKLLPALQWVHHFHLHSIDQNKFIVRPTFSFETLQVYS